MKKLFFILAFLDMFSQAPMAYAQTKTLRIGNQSIELTSDKRSTPALAVQMPTGDIWYGHLVAGTSAGRLTVQMPSGQIHSLVAPPGEPFRIHLTNMPANSQFSFQISARGNFTVDWGDGHVQTINRTNTILTTYSRTYTTAGNRIITITGRATGYNPDILSDMIAIPAISFQNSINLERMTGITGDLGSVFPILNASGAGTPRFYRTFQYTGITSIPPNLFAGLQGPPTNSMFYCTFCLINLSGSIPENLFAGLQGPPAPDMFRGTFIQSGLSGEIPGNLFAGINGPPAERMFLNTFNHVGYVCNFTSIGDGLFNGISGPARTGMFEGMFQNCIHLRGPSARSDGQFLYQKWPSATAAQVGNAYQGATGLSDRANIPAAWR